MGLVNGAIVYEYIFLRSSFSSAPQEGLCYTDCHLYKCMIKGNTNNLTPHITLLQQHQQEEQAYTKEVQNIHLLSSISNVSINIYVRYFPSTK
jgi:hypothetical protein